VRSRVIRVLSRLKGLKNDHDLRHRPTGFRFALAEGIDHVRADHWDALVTGHSVCLGRPFLRVLEAARPGNLKTHYALVYREDRPVAAVACQSLALDGSVVPSRKQGGRARALRDRGLERVRQRVLVCGNVLGWGPQGVALAPEEAREDLWPAVAEALYRIRRQDVLFGQTDLILVKDLGADETDADGPLKRFSYRPLETEPNMVLTLRPAWRTFDDYLGALRSDYRGNVRRRLKEIEARGFRVERLDAAGVARHAADLHRLYLEVHEKQRLRLVTIDPGFIPALAAAFGEAFRTTVIRDPGGALVGFVTMIRDREGAIAYYIGFDKEVASTGAPLYLRLLYAMVEDAILARAAWVSMGRTALEPKAGLGAVGHPLRCYVRHRIPSLNAVVRALVRGLPEPDQLPVRNAFKPTESPSRSET
jgi:hypothetical protein